MKNKKEKNMNTCEGCQEKFKVKEKEKKWKKLCFKCWQRNLEAADELNIQMDYLSMDFS